MAICLCLTAIAASEPAAKQSAGQSPIESRLAKLESAVKVLQEELSAIRRQLDRIAASPQRKDFDSQTNTTAVLDLASLSSLPSRGQKEAKVVLIEYSDFHCPYCRKFANVTLPDIKRDYIDTGRVQHVFVNFPLERLHPRAVFAAEAANCAMQQRQFWPMHDRLFSGSSYTTEDLVSHAGALRLNIPQFRECLTVRIIQGPGAEREQARKLGITSTPTFLIGVKESGGAVRVVQRISGAQPLRVFKESFDGVLK